MSMQLEEIVKEFHDNGNKKKVVFDLVDYYEIRYYALDGETLYNGDNPCLILYSYGKLDTLSWHNKDIEDDRPDEINFYKNGNVAFLKWFKKIFHGSPRYNRENGPARIYYNEDGELKSYSYMKCGIYHRTNGPAHFHKDGDGLSNYSWFYNDITYSIEVNKWLKENNFDNWQDMNENDFDRMWMEIL